VKRLTALALSAVLLLALASPASASTGPTTSNKGVICHVRVLDWSWSNARSITVLTKATCTNSGKAATLHLKWGTIVSWHRGAWLYWVIRHYLVKLDIAAHDRDHWLFFRSIHIGRADDVPQVYSYARHLRVVR
jgi:hypothetical protein